MQRELFAAGCLVFYFRYCTGHRWGARPPSAPMLSPTTIFGWNFFLPESAEKGEKEDLKLLQMAIKLAQRPDFMELRGEFYKWLSDISLAGIPPAEAKADMEKRIADYQKLME